ncbi:MAG: beta strand repeat-containing protein, partial [Acidobacteriota bacterium]
TAATNVLTCTSSVAIASSGTSVFGFTANVTATSTAAGGPLVNKGQVGGGADPTNPNAPTSTTVGQCTGSGAPNEGCATDSDTLNYVNLTLAKSNGVSNVTAGLSTPYTLTVTNNGNIATSGTITVVDVLPTGMTIPDGVVTETGAQAANWTCTATSNVVTCTSGTAIASSGTSVFGFTVNVTSTSTAAAGPLVNQAQVGGGGDSTNASAPTSTTAGQCTGSGAPNEGCATDSDTLDYVNLTLAKSNGATTVTAGGTTNYALTVTNSGNIATSGTITVVDVLPTGMTITDGAVTETGAQAANWTCTALSNVVTCTSSTTIASSGTSVFGFTVNVTATSTAAAGPLVNKAQVGGGGDSTNASAPTSTTAGQCSGSGAPNEGCATDSDTLDYVNLTLAKSNSTTNVTAGGTTTYALTVTNNGNIASSGTITVVDVLPTGITIADGAVTETGAQAANWTC